MIYQGIYMYLIQKHKMFKKIAKKLKGHYKIKKKKSNDIFITQLSRQLYTEYEYIVYVSFASVDEGHIIFKRNITKIFIEGNKNCKFITISAIKYKFRKWAKRLTE